MFSFNEGSFVIRNYLILIPIMSIIFALSVFGYIAFQYTNEGRALYFEKLSQNFRQIIFREAKCLNDIETKETKTILKFGNELRGYSLNLISNENFNFSQNVICDYFNIFYNFEAFREICPTDQFALIKNFYFRIELMKDILYNKIYEKFVSRDGKI